MPFISVENLGFQFPGHGPLFQNVTFSLQAVRTGLVGANGVGKSVLADILGGRRRADTGRVVARVPVGYFSQLIPEALLAQTLDEVLGLAEVLASLQRIARGEAVPEDFDRVGEDQWDLWDALPAMLARMGLPPNPHVLFGQLSGGQQVRLLLRQLFTSSARYLVLDEPSNHLDTEGRRWLLEQIQAFDGGVLVVSHDRNLLLEMDEILHLDGGDLHAYSGNYTAFFEQYRRQQQALERQLEDAKKQRKNVQRQLQSNREKAARRAKRGIHLQRSGSQAKVLLDKQKDRADKSRAAANQMAERRLMDINTKLNALVERPLAAEKPRFYFSAAEVNHRRVLDVLQLQLPFGVSHPLTFSIEAGARVSLQGANGVGKSTLLQVLAGALTPSAGNFQLRAQACYLDQHFSLLDNSKSAEDNLHNHHPHLPHSQVRTLLAAAGLHQRQALLPVGHLSGGERMKLALVIVAQQQQETLLLLDEPDNHLDLASKAVLAQALCESAYSLLVVSHDWHFLHDLGVTEYLTLAED